LKGRPDNQFLT